MSTYGVWSLARELFKPSIMCFFDSPLPYVNYYVDAMRIQTYLVLGSLRDVPKKTCLLCQLLAVTSLAISYLRREHELITGPSQFLEGLTHFDLALSSCIHFSSVECVDAMVPGCLHAVLDDGAFLGSTVGQPSS